MNRAQRSIFLGGESFLGPGSLETVDGEILTRFTHHFICMVIEIPPGLRPTPQCLGLTGPADQLIK